MVDGCAHELERGKRAYDDPVRPGRELLTDKVAAADWIGAVAVLVLTMSVVTKRPVERTQPQFFTSSPPMQKPVEETVCEGRHGANWTDAWDLRQPAARLTPTAQGHDALVDGCYLGADSAIVPRQHIEKARTAGETRPT